jgi:hypothetical protein
MLFIWELSTSLFDIDERNSEFELYYKCITIIYFESDATNDFWLFKNIQLIMQCTYIRYSPTRRISVYVPQENKSSFFFCHSMTFNAYFLCAYIFIYKKVFYQDMSFIYTRHKENIISHVYTVFKYLSTDWNLVLNLHEYNIHFITCITNVHVTVVFM